MDRQGGRGGRERRSGGRGQQGLLLDGGSGAGGGLSMIMLGLIAIVATRGRLGYHRPVR